MAAYRKRIAKFPLKLPSGPQNELCALFEELRLDVVAPPKRAQPRNSWISAPTWELIDRRATLRQQGKLSKRMARLLGRQIASGLKGDRRQRAANVAGNIEGLLASGETKEAWRCLKGWYKAASDAAPAASQLSLAAQTAERVDLYRKAPPPGGPPPDSRRQSRHSGRSPERWGTTGGCAGTLKRTCRGGVRTAGRAHQSVAPRCRTRGEGGQRCRVRG